MTIRIYVDESCTTYYRTSYVFDESKLEEIRENYDPDTGQSFLEYIRDEIWSNLDEWCDLENREEVDQDNWEEDDWDSGELDALEDTYPEYFQDDEREPDSKYLGEF